MTTFEQKEKIVEWLRTKDRDLFSCGTSVRDAAHMASKDLSFPVGSGRLARIRSETDGLEWLGGRHRPAYCSNGRFGQEWFSMIAKINEHRNEWPLDNPQYVAMKLWRINGRRVTTDEAREAIAALHA